MSRPKRPSATTKMGGDAAVQGLRETLRAFGKLDKDAQKAARDEVQKVANLLARELQSAGRAQGDSRNRHVAQSIRGTREEDGCEEDRRQEDGREEDGRQEDRRQEGAGQEDGGEEDRGQEGACQEDRGQEDRSEEEHHEEVGGLT